MPPARVVVRAAGIRLGATAIPATSTTATSRDMGIQVFTFGCGFPACGTPPQSSKRMHSHPTTSADAGTR